MTTFGELFSSQAKATAYQELAQGVLFRLYDGPNGLIGWELVVVDARGGYNRVNGIANRDLDRLLSLIGGDARFYNTLCGAQLTTSAATPDPTGSLEGLHHIYHPTTRLLYMATGSGSNVSLLKETSATDPTVAAVTYNPAAVITALATTEGALAATLVGKQTALAKYQTTIGTDAATIGNGTAGFVDVYGFIPTPVDQNRVLIMGADTTGSGAVTSNGIFSIQSSTTTLLGGTYDTVPASLCNLGGFPIGIINFGQLRPWWVEPLVQVGTAGTDVVGMLAFGSERYGRIFSTNLEGGDKQPMGTPELRGVLQAIRCDDGILADDGYVMYLYNSRETRLAPLFRERNPNSDREYRIRGMKKIGNEIVYLVNHVASPNGTGNTNAWFESWNLDTDAVHQISEVISFASTGVYGVLPAGELPLSIQNGFIHYYADGSWRRVKMITNGANPFYMQRQTSGSQSSTGDEFAATLTGTWPSMELPGLWGWPKWCTEMYMGGDFNAAGSAATAGFVTWGLTGSSGKTMTWTATATPQTDPAVIEDYVNGICGPFFKAQPYVTANRTTNSTRYTPNVFPVVFRGVCIRKPTATWEEVRDLIAKSR